MGKKTLADLPDLHGKKVLIRVDFNVPQEADGSVANDRRIRSALPTIESVLRAGGSAILMSHLGRPKGDPLKDAPYKMDPVARRLCDLLGRPVKKANAVVGRGVSEAARTLEPGEVLLLENLRFHPGEQKGDPGFAAQLAELGDVYVNDAFGTCHRSDASMLAVPAAMKGKPRVVGILVAKELEVLDRLLRDPPRPFLGLLGGAKVSDKVGFIKALLGRVDKVLIGGAMTYLFMEAQGRGIGKSYRESEAKGSDKTPLAMATELLELGRGKIILPVDHVVVTDVSKPETAHVVEGDIPAGEAGVDIGPKTIEKYGEEIAKAGTVIWNGPMGKFEDEAYSKGTRAVAEALARSSGITVVGGGETATAVEDMGLSEKMKHVSTGGGAFLEYVEGTPFKALDEIDEK
jgi:phosphoglycerate kinase